MKEVRSTVRLAADPATWYDARPTETNKTLLTRADLGEEAWGGGGDSRPYRP